MIALIMAQAFRKTNMRRWILLIVIILAVLLGLLIGLLNAELVTLDVLLTTLQASLGLVVMIAFVTGLLLGVLSLWVLRVLPMRFRLKRLQQELQSHNNQSKVSGNSANTALQANSTTSVNRPTG